METGRGERLVVNGELDFQWSTEDWLAPRYDRRESQVFLEWSPRCLSPVVTDNALARASFQHSKLVGKVR